MGTTDILILEFRVAVRHPEKKCNVLTSVNAQMCVSVCGWVGYVENYICINLTALWVNNPPSI